MGLEKLKELTDKVKEFRKKLMAEGEVIIKDAIKEVLDANPKIDGFRWEQYAPYFNDGEPCTFSVNEVRIKLVGLEDEDGDYEDGYLSEYDLRDTKWENNARVPLADDELPYGLTRDELKSLDDAASALYTAFQEIEEVMEQVFGNHVQVTATRKGIEVEEYDHD